ncbi:unnamed protein product [Meloidogyne enterolobii]|uniref:Uncharacterized protein n=1 Tax=Meloidogyne enterolobii TaxID=390850 RepID=A0ACB0ZEI5_MELEN
MGWFSFKFWFCFRLILASIAHFNWLTAIYVNCIFFTLWKSYDIFWFWFHLFLCICFPSLRPENYLIVFIRLIRAKYGEYSDKSFKEIYEQFYKYEGKTKAEVELKRVETLRREKRESRRAGNKKVFSTDFFADLKFFADNICGFFYKKQIFYLLHIFYYI